jgi:biopolymer transport protein ExbB
VRKLCLLLLCCLPTASFAWWNDDWNFRKEISFNLSASGADIAGSPADVAILLRLHVGNFGYFGDAQPDGSDLRFVASDDKTPLKHHVERYDATNQLAYIWLSMPRLTGGQSTDKVFLYYGNQKAATQPQSAETYGTAQVLVYHFGDGDTAWDDSTAYHNKASGSSAAPNAASLIAGGARFSGAQAVNIPASASLRLARDKGLTLSAWVRIDQPQSDAALLALEDAGRHVVLGIRGTQAYARVTGAAGEAEALATGALTQGSWHHLALVAGDERLYMYVDGVAAANTAVKLSDIGGALTIGNSAGGRNGFSGELDEAQVAAVARSADWIKAAYAGQSPDAPLVVYGNDAQKEGSQPNYFMSTLKNVTVDGWVVIVVLAIMFVIALLIMVEKAMYLGRVHRANGEFIKEFAKLRGDPTALDSREDADGDEALAQSAFMPKLGDDGASRFRFSTIYRLYHHGVHEMSGRVGHPSAGAKGVTTLTPQAISAINAAMDATLVRMVQKLQSRMVLLTIAIAGGPFLGLLGTVVGVMITFAAIAASGDVNVNSIAPGIAAALAATVAGLAVAIPALFGYNWLNTRIKEVTADMRVFVDEFVTRVAEYYS